jgi:hypothetical protein
MSFKITGTLTVIKDTVQVSEKFSAREFVISTEDDKYPQVISFQLVNDKTDIIEPYKLGTKVEVSFNLRGKSWTNPQGEVRYFNTLEAWRIENIGSAQAPIDSAKVSAIVEHEANAIEEDDQLLPF